MRIAVQGEGLVADRLRALVASTPPFVLEQASSAFAIVVRPTDGRQLVVDTPDGPFEQALFAELRDICRRHTAARVLGHLVLDAAGGNQDPRVMTLAVPQAFTEAQLELLVRALWIALLQVTRHGQVEDPPPPTVPRRAWWRAWLPVLLLLLSGAAADAQTNRVTFGGVTQPVTCTSGCAAGTSDTDDGSVATGQSVGLTGSEGMAYDGSVWRRVTFGVAGTASAQVWTVQGIASMTPLLVGDGAGALNVVCDSGCGGAATFEDNDPFTADTTAVNVSGFLYDATPSAMTDGNAGAPRMSSNRVPYSTIRDAAGNERGANVNASFELLTTDAFGNAYLQAVAGASEATAAPIAGTQTLMVGGSDGTNATRLEILSTHADNVANTRDGVITSAFGYIFDGATWDRWTGAVTQAGTWNVTNVSGTVSLPTGASTLAEQQTQTTALQLVDDVVYVDDTATHATGTSKGVLLMGAAAPTDAAVNANDIGAIGMTVNREAWVSLMTALPAGDADVGNVDLEIAGTGVSTGVGASGAQTLRTATLLHDGTDTALVSAAGELSVAGNVTANAGTNLNTSALLTTTAHDSALGTAGTADTQVRSVQGIASMTPLLVQPQAVATGAATTLSFISAGATEDKHAVCTGACSLYSIGVTNINAAVRFLKCENDTSANTAPGTDTPEFRMAVPGATTGAGFTHTFPVGAAFGTALTCWLVTGAADSDVAEVAANELMVFYTFKQ